MSEYFKYEALDIPDKPATEVLKSKGLDLDFTPRQYQFIPELNTGDFHINGTFGYDNEKPNDKKLAIKRVSKHS